MIAVQFALSLWLSVHQLSAIATPEYRCFAYGVIHEKKKK
jgi:hypothetical protein